MNPGQVVDNFCVDARLIRLAAVYAKTV